jgi:hypothetical protein
MACLEFLITYFGQAFIIFIVAYLVEGGSRADFAAMAVRRGIPVLELPRNYSGFSEASGTL